MGLGLGLGVARPFTLTPKVPHSRTIAPALVAVPRHSWTLGVGRGQMTARHHNCRRPKSVSHTATNYGAKERNDPSDFSSLPLSAPPATA